VTRAPAEVLASLGRPRVVVVGDLMLDRYLTGTVERISPEAPVQVLRVDRDESRLGGAGSVAHDLAVLGARAALVGVLGPDAAGESFRRMAAEARVELHAVEEEGRPTTVKTRHLARRHAMTQQMLRVDAETTVWVDPGVERRLVAALDAALASADALLVSDYAKGCLTPGVLLHALAWGKRTGKPVVVDPKGEDFAKYLGATGITPNRAEAGAATGLRVRTVEDAIAAAERLVERLELRFALVTLDRDGMVLKDAGAEPRHVPTAPREVGDVTGAGDMVLAVLGLVLAAGGTAAEGATLANVAAGIEVERVGVVPLRRDEIEARLSERVPAGGRKVVDRADAAALVQRLRAAGRSVVFTNGCFDLLHAGHVRYLRFAREQGDALVVGLNSDASVRRLKGPDRPVNGAADRAEVLAALADVDHVIVFEEDDPAALLADVRPDVLVKGEDWRDKGVVGRALVESYGGRVVLAPLLEGRSTSGTIERLKKTPKKGAPRAR
jgi:D-beta-D-heptose 7-phosphate kinase/D-beta-D-heptose 1-phosphate adenosyltransferase